MKPSNQKAPGSNRDTEIYDFYVWRCINVYDIRPQTKDIATPQKYFDINRTAGKGGL